MGEGPETNKLLGILLILPVVLFSLTVHEFAHAWAAKRFGDPTAEQEGRLTLDPMAHIDPMGLLMIVLSSYAGFGFGWAKPVPVRLGNCRRPLQAMLWVSAAGPLSNLLQAVVGIVVLIVLGLCGAHATSALMLGAHAIMAGNDLDVLTIVACIVGQYVITNIVLALFNVLPVPPLDGSKIAMSVLPYQGARFLAQLESYGFVVLLLACPVLGQIVGAIMHPILLGLLYGFLMLGFH